MIRGPESLAPENMNRYNGPIETPERSRTMNEQAARALAATLGGNARFPVSGSSEWTVNVERPDGHIAVIEDHVGTVYRDRAALDALDVDGDQDGIVSAC
jgi:hypothetical protein